MPVVPIWTPIFLPTRSSAHVTELCYEDCSAAQPVNMHSVSSSAETAAKNFFMVSNSPFFKTIYNYTSSRTQLQALFQKME